MTVLADGGNAVDAAIAANAVQGVVAPETCGIGGDLFALVWTGDSTEPAALNASGRAGTGAEPKALEDFPSIPFDHPQAVTIPGCVDGWHALARRFGTKTVSELVETAIQFADAGFPASTEHVRAFGARQRDLAHQPAGEGIYRDEQPPGLGDRIQRPSLARSLELAGAGRDEFYLGDPGQQISTAVGGIIDESDLAQSQADWVEPLALEVFGHTAWTIPPNSQGYLLLAAARILELSGGAIDSIHHQIEAHFAAAASRRQLLAEEPPIPLDDILREERLASLAAAISADRAARWEAWQPLPGGTEYHCVVDRNGMAVSFIQSNYHGIGSGIGAGTAGFFLQDRGAGFTLEDGHPNQLAPGRRPAHTLSPTIWSRRGQLSGVLGTRGGDAQPQLLLRIAVAAFGHDVSPAEAQALGRWIARGFDPGEEADIRLEPQLSGSVADGLTARGHRVTVMDDEQPGWGPASLIKVDREGLRIGATDPRVDTTSVAVL